MGTIIKQTDYLKLGLSLGESIANFYSRADSELDSLFPDTPSTSQFTFNQTPTLAAPNVYNGTPLGNSVPPLSPGLSKVVPALFNQLKAYQPFVVACKIAGGCAYKFYRKDQNQKNLNKSLNQVIILQKLVKKNNDLILTKTEELVRYRSLELKAELRKNPRNQSEIKYILSKIGRAKQERDKASSNGIKFQERLSFHHKEIPRLRIALQSTVISLAELFALGFAHPGANVWKSCTDLSGRISFFCHHLFCGRSKKQPSLKQWITAMTSKECIQDSLSNAGVVLLATIATTGTLLSILKHSGYLSGQDPYSQWAFTLGGAAQVIEGAIMMKGVALTTKNFVQARLNK